MIYDAIIIGKGPAGISAALYNVRANMKTLVLGTQSSALIKAGSIENYYGFSQPISGKRLLEEGESQLKRIGGDIREEEVVGKITDYIQSTWRYEPAIDWTVYNNTSRR